MAALTEKDLENKRKRVENLREQIAAQEAKAAAVIQEESMAIEGAQLDAEAARLEAQLNAAKEAAKVGNIRGGSSGPLEAAQAQLEAAQVGFTPPGVVVDTNSEADASKSQEG